MLSERRDGAADLRLAAQAAGSADRDHNIATLPSELEAPAHGLRAAERAHYALASRVVPAAELLLRGASGRYQREAASWPIQPSPPYERFAATVASLHEAASAAHLAAGRCCAHRELPTRREPPSCRPLWPSAASDDLWAAS
jgi:hypothetical protein